MIKVTIVWFTLPFRPGIIDFGIRVADESTVVKCFKEGLGRWEYLVMIHKLKCVHEIYDTSKRGGRKIP